VRILFFSRLEYFGLDRAARFWISTLPPSVKQVNAASIAIAASVAR
jgi:hypothetical protein